MGEYQITPVMSVKNMCVIFTPIQKWLNKSQKPAKTPTISSTSTESDRKSRKLCARLFIHAFITVWADYSNSLMNELRENLIKKPQCEQITTTSLVFNLRKYDRLTPALNHVY